MARARTTTEIINAAYVLGGILVPLTWEADAFPNSAGSPVSKNDFK